MDKDLLRYFNNGEMIGRSQLLHLPNSDDDDLFLNIYGGLKYLQKNKYAYDAYLHTKEQQANGRNVNGSEQKDSLRRNDISILNLHILSREEKQFIHKSGYTINIDHNYIGSKVSVAMYEDWDPTCIYIHGYFKVEGYQQQIAIQSCPLVSVEEGISNFYDKAIFYIYAKESDFFACNIEKRYIYAIADGCLFYKDHQNPDKILVSAYSTLDQLYNYDKMLQAAMPCQNIKIEEPIAKFDQTKPDYKENAYNYGALITYSSEGCRYGYPVDQAYRLDAPDNFPVHLNVKGWFTVKDGLTYSRVVNAQLEIKKISTICCAAEHIDTFIVQDKHELNKYYIQFCKEPAVEEEKNYDWKTTISKADLLTDSVDLSPFNLGYNGKAKLNIKLEFNAPFGSQEYINIESSDTGLASSEKYNEASNTNICYLPMIDFIWGCFAKDTEVLMADGKVKNIQDVVEGDLVMTENGGSTSVKGTFTGIDRHMYKIEAMDGNSIIVTHDHPMATARGLVPACELTFGDQLKKQNGEAVDVKYAYIHPGEYDIFNIALENSQLFYANGYLTGDIKTQKLNLKNRRNKRVLTANEKGLIDELKSIITGVR